MANFAALSVAGLVLTLVLLLFTLPSFRFLKGNLVELPIAMIVLELGVLGTASAQIGKLRRGKDLEARALTTTSLVQALIMVLVQVYIFVALPAEYYWYPIVSLILVIALVGVISAQVRQAHRELSRMSKKRRSSPQRAPRRGSSPRSSPRRSSSSRR